MSDGRLAGSSGPVEPKNNGVLIVRTRSKDPIHNYIDNGGRTAVQVFGWYLGGSNVSPVS